MSPFKLADVPNRGTLADGSYGKLRFTARYVQDQEGSGTCDTCGGGTRRSALTGILHDDCYGCRHLKMIFGPNIKVQRIEEK